jgi:hypothetical protein
VLTVSSLLAEFDLDLAVADAPDNSIRWVHISELEDPTPFLSGGELLLTTGINLKTAARQRKFVRLLADKDAAGLGLAVGLDHTELPPALIEEAQARGLPLFELPFELPFIAVTEWASRRLVNEGYQVLERGIEVHALLEGIVLAERGLPEVMRAIAESVSGAAIVASSSHAIRRSAGSLSRRFRTFASRSTSVPRPAGRRCSWPSAALSPDGRSRSPSRSAVAARAAIGSSSPGAAAGSAISSGSSPARRPSWWRSR